jgi:uncharacterized tellurite resistance protein B-like protein
MDEETSLQICGLIAGVISSDEQMHASEADFLQRVRKSLGLAKGAQVEPVRDRDEAVARLRGFSEEVRAEALDLLIQAAASDGKIAPAERAFLDVVAAELAVDPEELDDRLQAALATSRPQPFRLAD